MFAGFSCCVVQVYAEIDDARRRRRNLFVKLIFCRSVGLHVVVRGILFLAVCTLRFLDVVQLLAKVFMPCP